MISDGIQVQNTDNKYSVALSQAAVHLWADSLKEWMQMFAFIKLSLGF